MALDFDNLLRSLQVQRGRGFGRAGDRVAEAHLQPFEELQDMTLELTKATAAKAQAIRKNPKLTAVGQREELQKLATATSDDAKFLGKRITVAREAIAELRSLVFDYRTPPKGADTTLAFLREQEIRQWYRALSPVEQIQYFMTATERGDGEILRALLTAPGHPLLTDPELLARGESRYAERNNPQGWARLQALQVFHDGLTLLATQVGQALVNEGADRSVVEQHLSIQLPVDALQVQLEREAAQRAAAKGAQS